MISHPDNEQGVDLQIQHVRLRALIYAGNYHLRALAQGLALRGRLGALRVYAMELFRQDTTRPC
jgi:hypothetical protein